MKKTCLAIGFLFFVVFLEAQGQSTLNTSSTTSVQLGAKIPTLDKSPMDMSYFPADYPILKT